MFALSILVKHASRSKHKQHRHVAVLTKGGAIVSIGYNHGSCHAEVKAINQLWKDHRPGLVLWSFRLTRKGNLALAKPCPACQHMLVKNGIKKVHYSDQDGEMITMKLTVS
jgi:deoxycytidylate deaminase